MKTYYFNMHWEDEWECGDGCCSGCGEWVINFQEMVDEHGNHFDMDSIGTSWTVEDALRQVYEIEYEEYVPDFVWEGMDFNEQQRWLTNQLLAHNVQVVFKEHEESFYG